MPQTEIILFLETPRSGGEKGHRWLVPQASRPITEMEITRWSAELEGEEPDGRVLYARRKVSQVMQGNTREAWEMLVAAGLPFLDMTERKRVTILLEQFLDAFDPNRVDWEGVSGLVIPTVELDPLYSTLLSLPTVNDRESPITPPFAPDREGNLPRKKRKMKKIVLGILSIVLVLWAIFTLLPDRRDNSDDSENAPTWKSFLTLQNESFRPGRNGDGSAIDDAKYLWENVTVSNWTGGDFLRADLTRNSPEALRFLELEKPEVWYESDAFKNSDDADELRTILAALRTSSPPEGTPFGREFVEALAESSEQLISADLNQLDSVAVEFLERQRAKLQDIPANDRLEWTTPADGRRAAVLFNTISELSRTGTAPPERRIRTWEDVFSDGIANATSAAAGRSSDPVVVLQWNLMKPIDTWASSAR